MISFRIFLLMAVGLCLQATSVSRAEELTEAKATQLAQGLHYQTGKIVLEGGVATLQVPENFAFLDRKGAKTVITELWGNPPDDYVLGLIVPKGFDPLDGKSWAVEVYFDDSGYVSDKDAKEIDYQKLLVEMQEGTKEANQQRIEQGYPSIRLVGWAAAPHYDPVTHKLYWAKELVFGDNDHTLNYNIRSLGRRGVLVLNAIARMDQLPEIEKAVPEILGMVSFDEGHRYADFDPKVDKVAGYGLAALVTGGVLAKTGVLKGLFLALLAGKKFLIGGAFALIALAARFFKKKN